jgi:hypothetical protein
MTTTTRIIHHDDPAPVKAAAFAQSNPLASVPETARVWIDESGILVPVTDWLTFVATVRKTRLIFNTDLFSDKYNDVHRNVILKSLASRLKIASIDPSTVAFITDWESWATNPPNPKAEFDWWYGIMQSWPGPIGNYGNAEGKHVAEFLRWPWLRNIPNGRGVSCPSAYGLGLSPDGLRKTIAVCRSIRPPNPPKARRVVAFIADDAFHKAEGYAQADYIKAAKNKADIIIWNISSKHDAAKFPSFGPDDRLHQDRITADNLKVRK